MVDGLHRRFNLRERVNKMALTNFHSVPHGDKWAVRQEGQELPMTIVGTQAEAEAMARELPKSSTAKPSTITVTVRLGIKTAMETIQFRRGTRSTKLDGGLRTCNYDLQVAPSSSLRQCGPDQRPTISLSSFAATRAVKSRKSFSGFSSTMSAPTRIARGTT